MATEPSRQVLDAIPGRVLTFLIAVGKYVAIRAALASRGYTAAEHELAWNLLKKLGSSPASSTPVLDGAVRDAIVALDAWDEPNFAIIRAALERSHVGLVDFVFDGLAPKQGSEAVMSVSTLLDRLDALESSPARKATRKTDHAALETLASRGYTKEERARLRGLVASAQSFVAEKPLSDEERDKTLRALLAWHNEWSTIARVVLTRRDHQISAGIARRRKPPKGAPTAPVTAPPAGAAPAAPAGDPAAP